MQEGLDAFKSGQVAMQMNWFAFFPGLSKDEKVGGDRIGFFVNPSQKVEASTSAARASRSCLLFAEPGGGLAYIKWFAQPDVQKKWWSLGGYAVHKAVVGSGFRQIGALRGRLPQGHGRREGLLAGAAYAQLLLDMQKRVHDYVVAEKGTAKEALDLLVKIGRRPSTKKARSDDARSPGPGACGVRPDPSSPGHPDGADMNFEAPVSRFSDKAAALTPADAAFRLRSLSDRTIAWLFIAPTIVLLLAINIFPLIWTIRLSFTNYRANRPNRLARYRFSTTATS